MISHYLMLVHNTPIHTSLIAKKTYLNFYLLFWNGTNKNSQLRGVTEATKPYFASEQLTLQANTTQKWNIEDWINAF